MPPLIEIKANALGHGTLVVDGTDISHAIRECQVIFEPGRMNEVHLVLWGDIKVELDNAKFEIEHVDRFG